MEMYGTGDVGLVGKHLGNYRLTQLLGRGSFAEVYLAEHRHLKMQAAIKVLHTHIQEREAEAFYAEARTLAQLEHPNIIRVLEGGIDGDVPYLVMAYAPNGTLQQRYRLGQCYEPHVILPHVMQIADALSYAHQRRIVHRDMKPENVLLGVAHEALLSDFGLAVIAHHTHSQHREAFAGSVNYMAPEVIQGHPRPASDQYALAAIMYTWLSGKPLFAGTFREVLSQHLTLAPTSLTTHLPDVHPGVAHVIERALAKDPHQRFPDISSFARAFEQACLGEPGPYEAGYQAQPGIVERERIVEIPTGDEALSTRQIEAETQRIPASTRRVSRRAVVGSIALGAGIIAVGGGVSWWALRRSEAAQSTPKKSRTSTHSPAQKPLPPFGTRLLIFNGHDIHNDPQQAGSYNTITALGWSPDGRLIASADLNRILVWDAGQGKLSAQPQEQLGSITRLNWRDNDTLVSINRQQQAGATPGASESDVRVWKAHSGVVQAIYHSGGNAIPIVVSPDGKSVLGMKNVSNQENASNLGNLLVWDLVTGETQTTHPGLHLLSNVDAAWSADGKYIATAFSMGGSSGDVDIALLGIMTWRRDNGSDLVSNPSGEHDALHIAWQPGGRLVATGYIEGHVRVWDAFSGAQQAIFQAGQHGESVLALGWSPDGTRLAASIGSLQAQGYVSAVPVWDIAKKQLLGSYAKHTDYVRAMAWSPDSTRIASTDGSVVHIWQAE